MPGWIAGMLRICKERWYGGIRLAGPQLEICVFRVPAGERGVMLGDGLVGIRARGTRRVQVQVILKDLQIDLLEPRLEKPGLPEPGQMVGAVRAAEVLYPRVLRAGGIGSECGRRAKTEVLRRG